ncbi:hypothetical protein R8Z57_10280 [Microbacterium sp. M3]|uniref:Uncharacterized protein n=1 Tax=Microbacterium arthrosphaerae TaxID=792652 RepID=A0ABU4H3A8_9MICO|nr:MULTISPECIES: hypothetical protein [Microbacterium]MDW4573155.1 hypothetical protein [Microbacterium arthrosphaerae]MDW7607010.1 hypothetical protein [Microbacterium sp. M3]
MPLDADALLAGPRGRRLCLELARRSAERAERPSQQESLTVLWWAARAYDPYPGVVLTMRSPDEGSPSEPPTPSASDAAAALDTLAFVEPTAAALRDALEMSVSTAMYWQEPDGVDGLCATPELTEPLRRIAELISAAPAAGWWSTGLAEDDQWTIPWEGAGRAPTDLDAQLHAWRDETLADDARAAAERPDDPAAPWGGYWWSIPPHGMVRTTRSLGADGPARLWFEEDSLGGDEAVATPVDAYPARVIEIDGAEDWAELCRRHPLDVTASRRQDWYRVTGRDGPWVIPDWVAVATVADAVHLTVAGYLAAATRLIELGDGRASVLAGWNPDETFWFRGVSPRPADQQRWRRDDGVWRREPD